MVRNTQTIRRQQPTNYFSVFDNFVGLALKVLRQVIVIITRIVIFFPFSKHSEISFFNEQYLIITARRIYCIKPFPTNVPILYPLKTLENQVFWYFERL